VVEKINDQKQGDNNSQNTLDPETLSKLLNPEEKHLAHQLQISSQTRQRIESIKIKDQEKSEDTVLALIAYFWILALIPMLTIGLSDFVKYHARQGIRLAIFITVWMFVWWLLFYYLSYGIWIIWVINVLILFWIISGVIHVANQEKKPLFLIGQIGEK
jgi:uncharacterized membrane protein